MSVCLSYCRKSQMDQSVGGTIIIISLCTLICLFSSWYIMQSSWEDSWKIFCKNVTMSFCLSYYKDHSVGWYLYYIDALYTDISIFFMIYAEQMRGLPAGIAKIQTRPIIPPAIYEPWSWFIMCHHIDPSSGEKYTVYIFIVLNTTYILYTIQPRPILQSWSKGPDHDLLSVII